MFLSSCPELILQLVKKLLLRQQCAWHTSPGAVRYFDNIVYRNNLSNIVIRYFFAIAITATEIIMC